MNEQSTVPSVGREDMVENWADVVADRIVDTSPLRKGKPGSSDATHRRWGTLLLLGAADTGKTTLMDALVKRLAHSQPVALVDADIGQSHIGPPTTVGWSILDRECSPAAPGWEKITPEGGRATRGFAFVGDVTPVGHLLQLTAALALCVEQARQAAEVVLVDTPGLVAGGAACSLWWTVQRLLRPQRIIAIQRENELGELLGGLQGRAIGHRDDRGAGDAASKIARGPAGAPAPAFRGVFPGRDRSYR